MKFQLLYLAAWLRGLFYRWPNRPSMRGWSSVSCGLRYTDAKAMYAHGWIPWTYQLTPIRGARIAGLFLVDP